MIGIYKITNPKGAIYVGQSKDIEKRIRGYGYSLQRSKRQQKLHNSIKKYGYENHTFEVIEECELELLNEREIYWISKLSSCHYINKEYGMNLTIGGEGAKGMIRSADVIKQHSVQTTGLVRDEEQKLRVSVSLKGKPKPEGFSTNRKKRMVKRQTPEKEIISRDPNHYLTGNTRPDWVREKISQGLRNKKIIRTAETVEKMKQNCPWNRKVLQYDQEDNFIKEWRSGSEAGRCYGIDSTGIYLCCRGKQHTAAGYKWKYKNE